MAELLKQVSMVLKKCSNLKIKGSKHQYMERAITCEAH